MNTKKTSIDMCNGPLSGKILRFTIPIILSGVLQLLFNAMDMVVVGRYASDTALAAVGSTGSVINLLVNLFMGFSIGSGIAISHEIGAGRKKNVLEIVNTSILLSLISGVLVGVTGFVLSRTILIAMDSPANVIDQSTLYLRIIFVGMPMNMVYNFGSSMLRAMGDTKRPLYYLAVSGIINVVLNLIFVIVFHMDVDGVAYATIISQTVSAALVVRNLVKGNEFVKLDLRKMKIHRNRLSKILKIGLPAGVQSSMFAISNILIHSSINSFGSVAVSGIAAAGSIEGFVYIVMNAFGQSATTFSGQNMGAKKYSRITRTMLACVGMVSLRGLLLGVAVIAFAQPLSEIYCPTDLKAVAYSVERLQVIVGTYFLCGIMEVIGGVLRGMGYSFRTMIISLFGVCVFRVVWVFSIFRYVHTLNCLYISYPVSWTLVSLVNIVLYIVIRKGLKEQKTVVV